MKKRKILLSVALATLFTLVPLSACGSQTPPKTDGEVSASDETTLSPENGFNSDTGGSDAVISPPESSEESSEDLTPTPKKEYDRYVRCTGNNVNLRSGAGTNYNAVGTAEKDTTYQVLGEYNGWYKTQYKNSVVYISSKYVKEFSLEKSENDEVEEVLAVGYKLIGTKYVFGATRLHDGKGNFLYGFKATKFDCSSFTQYAFYYGADVLLNTTTRTQVKQGTFVKRNDLARGDCIYFTNAERKHLTGVERIGHVAIYLGEGYILHTASDFARIEKISSARWEN
ncbi:MAG: C40 family peptidase, partial [Clostridia bacterium]|nr:C40 family peptidase [Clostridia bacterium]